MTRICLGGENIRMRGKAVYHGFRVWSVCALLEVATTAYYTVLYLVVFKIAVVCLHMRLTLSWVETA